jgi:protochlorophyllide reductase
MQKANEAADKIRTNIANDADDAVAAISMLKSLKLIPMACDLADLTGVDSFVKQLSGEKFDAVCYNAGIARNTDAKDVARTKQGFELTVGENVSFYVVCLSCSNHKLIQKCFISGTNHLGHFYLNHLILPMIKDSGRIVVTASGVHDPDSPGGAQGVPATLGDLSGLEKAVLGDKKFDMVDGGAFNADKAYKDSKLCNVLFTRELQRRLTDRGSGVRVNCFNPGLIVGK